MANKKPKTIEQRVEMADDFARLEALTELGKTYGDKKLVWVCRHSSRGRGMRLMQCTVAEAKSVGFIGEPQARSPREALDDLITDSNAKCSGCFKHLGPVAKTKEEKSLLLFLEDMTVNKGGMVLSGSMNDWDFGIAVKWAAKEFIRFGRLKFHNVRALHRGGSPCSHWVQLSDKAHREAAAERFARARRSQSAIVAKHLRNQ